MTNSDFRDDLSVLLGAMTEQAKQPRLIPFKKGRGKRNANASDAMDYAAFLLRQLGDEKGWWL